MDEQTAKNQKFYAIGLNYQKADASVRGKFSLDKPGKEKLLKNAKIEGYKGVLVLSTCNRTEVYGFSENPFQLIKLLCQFTQGSLDEFEKVAFVYKNQEAVSHLFKVGTGLDSQILGDFEIIGQVKGAFALSKNTGLNTPFLDRLVNSVIQASKRIKTETGISSGATSVSFAAVQYILRHAEDISHKNITLFGTGKIGRNTVENLVKHTKNEHITLINRTKNKAEAVAGKFNLIVKDYADLQAEIRKTDILIVATGASSPTITKELLHCHKDLLVLDLSIPKNVDDDVESLAGIRVAHVDELSKLTDATLAQRRSYLPEAEAIIEAIKDDFRSWLETRKFVPTIKALKEKLKTIKDVEITSQQKKAEDFDGEQAEIIGDRIIKKIMNRFASHLREDDSGQSLELMQNVFKLEEIKE